MNRDNAKKKVLNYLLIAGALVAVAVVLFFVLKSNDGADADLRVYAHDISMTNGESKKIEYEVNFSNAVVRFDVVDDDIAEIDGEMVVSKEVGETEIVIIARYSDMIYEKRITLTVTEPNDEEKGEDSPIEETPETPNKDDSSEEEDDLPEDDTPNEQISDIQVFDNINCEVDGTTIKMSPNKKATITFGISEGNLEIEAVKSNSGNLYAGLCESMGFGIELRASTTGEYLIAVTFDSEVVTYKVIVE